MEQRPESLEQPSRYPKVEEWVMSIFLKIQILQKEIRTTSQCITKNNVANIVGKNIDTTILTAIACAVIFDPVDTEEWKKITTPNQKNKELLTKIVTDIIDRALQKKNELWNQRWEKGVLYIIQKIAEEIIASVGINPSYACDYSDPDSTNGDARRRDMILQAKMDVRRGLRAIYDPLQKTIRRRRGYYDD